MAFDKTNTFSLNRNDKGGNEKRPDYKGEVNIDGVRYWLSGWIRQGPDGSFISGPIERADDKYQYGTPVGTTASGDDIPF